MTPDQDIISFFEKHLAVPGGVIVVFHGDDIAVFDSFDKAQAWAIPLQDGCVFAPYVINEPEFGNLTKSERN